MTKRRQYKFIDEFANAIDVIVRGVKSGLPLIECLNIIARESPQPISGEFTELVEQQRVGVPLAEAFDRMMIRMPLPEVRFFAIVIAIQQQAGGNLSEALGNLSGVLRDRKRLRPRCERSPPKPRPPLRCWAHFPFVVMVSSTSPRRPTSPCSGRTRFGQFLAGGGGLLDDVRRPRDEEDDQLQVLTCRPKVDPTRR